MKEFKDYMDIKMQNKQDLFDAMHEEYKNKIKQSTEKEITFEAIRIDNSELISSSCLIQKYICEELKVLLNENGRWHYVKPETLKIR